MATPREYQGAVCTIPRLTLHWRYGKMPKPTMEILSDDECIALLHQVPVGRIAVTVDALPVIFPINFAIVDDAPG